MIWKLIIFLKARPFVVVEVVSETLKSLNSLYLHVLYDKRIVVIEWSRLENLPILEQQWSW